jgi:polar amino acid transport system substrate-binding protein
MQLKDYEDLALQLSSVSSGQIPAAINDIPVLLDYAKQNDDVEVSAQFQTGERYGFGMRKDSSEALEKVVNRVIERAKSDGTYDRLYEQWFGAEPR